MRRFLIAAAAALTFATPAIAQSHGGYGGPGGYGSHGGYNGQSYRGDAHRSGYGRPGGYYGPGPESGYNDRGYDDRRSRHAWRDEVRHERREEYRRRDHHDRW